MYSLQVRNVLINLHAIVLFLFTISASSCKNRLNYNTKIMYGGLHSLNKNHQSKKTSSLYIISKVSVFKIRDIKIEPSGVD